MTPAQHTLDLEAMADMPPDTWKREQRNWDHRARHHENDLDYTNTLTRGQLIELHYGVTLTPDEHAALKKEPTECARRRTS